MSNTVVLPLAYLPPIEYFRLMVNHKEVLFDANEHFHKQYYYNRCMIYGPNGALKLIIPLEKRNERKPLKDIRISYSLNWRILHWRSFEASYRRSPYFEFYESYFQPVYSDFAPEFLMDWNLKLLEVVNGLLNTKPVVSFTNEYVKEYPEMGDYRKLASPAEVKALPQGKKYNQVFEEKHGFISNLSIIDLLFCEGNHSIDILKSEA